ncbi:MAG: hypothetical protein IJZ07_01060 [Clostridia bacterium]|nr:hypothetical protein [Clostridia bacterium]
MYDLHCHILFGVDDGADSAEESVRMARIACDGGSRGIVATPHCNISEFERNEWTSEFTKKLIMLNSTLAELNIPLKIYPGQEIFCGDDVPQLLKSGKFLTINGSRYVLVEFDFGEYSENVYSKLSRIISEGYVPIVAHPERYGFVQENSDAPYRMKNMGCLLQINKGSVKGGFGRGAFLAAKEMLDAQLVDFAASDGHGPFMRTPFLADAHELISENHSADYADLIFKINPKRVLKNKNI